MVGLLTAVAGVNLGAIPPKDYTIKANNLTYPQQEVEHQSLVFENWRNHVIRCAELPKLYSSSSEVEILHATQTLIESLTERICHRIDQLEHAFTQKGAAYLEFVRTDVPRKLPTQLAKELKISTNYNAKAMEIGTDLFQSIRGFTLDHIKTWTGSKEEVSGYLYESIQTLLSEHIYTTTSNQNYRNEEDQIVAILGELEQSYAKACDSVIRELCLIRELWVRFDLLVQERNIICGSEQEPKVQLAWEWETPKSIANFVKLGYLTALE